MRGDSRGGEGKGREGLVCVFGCWEGGARWYGEGGAGTVPMAKGPGPEAPPLCHVEDDSVGL